MTESNNKTTWIEVLPETGLFLYRDAEKIRRALGQAYSIKSDEAGMSIKCNSEEHAQEAITKMRKLATLLHDYHAWIIADEDWRGWSPESAKTKPITVPGRSARKSREKYRRSLEKPDNNS